MESTRRVAKVRKRQNLEQAHVEGAESTETESGIPEDVASTD